MKPINQEKLKTNWPLLSVEASLKELGSNQQTGLSRDEALKRLATHGRNQLAEGSTRSWQEMLKEQFASVLVLVLLGASGISALMGSFKDALAILTIVILNALLGFVQEARAEKAMSALKKLSVPRVRLRRGNETFEVDAGELVPGDIVLIEAGNLAPADGRIIESAGLRIQEAILTGESEAIDKRSEALADGGMIPLGDQVNMAFMGTSISYGRGQMLVTATGMNTELGHVAGLIQEVEQGLTPLQQRLNKLGHALAAIALVVVVCIFVGGVWAGEDLHTMFMIAVSMAVAVIPEGLPAVVTISLALGAQRMLKRRALIRRLTAVETLGSVTVICSDKTGTLTENKMTMTIMDMAGHRINIAEHLSHREPVTNLAERHSSIYSSEPALALALAAGALCSDAVLKADEAHPGRMRALGDPTEGALVVAAAHYSLLKSELEAAFPRISEIPFDSDRKRMTTIHKAPGADSELSRYMNLAADSAVVFSKGAVDSLLEVSSSVWDQGKIVPLNASYRERIEQANLEMAQNGMRVLGLCFRILPGSETTRIIAENSAESSLVFLGMSALIDPPRTEVKPAIETCRTAGIRTVMITGDHPITAERIARDLGILDRSRVITGNELAQYTPAQLEDIAASTSVYARVAPEQKLRIVEALQRRGHVVAMTGDGVNDAPALRRADIGVAMGITGTDVSKEASAMVLMDDNFTTIVAAVEEGRAINDNIMRFLMFSLAGNIGKVMLVFIAPLMGLPIPLTPFQILWLNLATDGVLGLGIGLERAEPDTMRKPPRTKDAGLFSDRMGWKILVLGLLLGSTNLAVAVLAWNGELAVWQSIVMTTVVLLQIVEAQVSRSSSVSFFRTNPLTNPVLLGACALILVLQLVVVYLPLLAPVFSTAPMTADAWIAPLIAALVVLLGADVLKLLLRK